MSFWKDYPNRKDHRKPHATPSPDCAALTCPWCRGNRFHAEHVREASAGDKLLEYRAEPPIPANPSQQAQSAGPSGGIDGEEAERLQGGGE